MAFGVTVLSQVGHHKEYKTDKSDMHFNLDDNNIIIKVEQQYPRLSRIC